MEQPSSVNWWQKLYDDIVAEVFLVRKDSVELQRTVRFLCEQLRLRPGATVFDQCCGIGSHSEALAREGMRLIGVDQSPGYIDRATAEARQQGLDCTFHVGDACTFTPDCAVDAVLNWGTSFGNAEDDRNAMMLRRAIETLRPGGWFALDYQHVPRILRHFQPTMLHRLDDERGETLIVRESSIDLSQGTLQQRWTLLLPDGTRQVRHSNVRLYLPHELARLLGDSGFVELRFLGSIHAEPLTLDSPRCIVVAGRPV